MRIKNQILSSVQVNKGSAHYVQQERRHRFSSWLLLQTSQPAPDGVWGVWPVTVGGAAGSTEDGRGC